MAKLLPYQVKGKAKSVQKPEVGQHMDKAKKKKPLFVKKEKRKNYEGGIVER